MLEILKLVVSILGGGAAGAFLNEWFRRRKSKIQSISLIERVNRLVSPELEGITLARLVGDEPQRRLEELRNVRQYQLTLRNTSTINLQNVEIQFEFPVEDVQSWASRPSLSKTALVQVDAAASEPWKMSYRWRIPHLPSGDSVEFTFWSVNAPSGDFEVALYNSELVIVEKVVGEPAPKERRFNVAAIILPGIGALVVIAVIVGFSSGFLVSPNGEEFSGITAAGCELRIVSFYDRYGQSTSSPYRIKHRVFNVGDQPCVLQSAQLNPKGPFTVSGGEIFEREWITGKPPKLVDEEVSVGAINTQLKNVPIRIYVER
ncbi:MAG TPA: hypothetical protein VGE83_02270 [Terracidiphilus sp.]